MKIPNDHPLKPFFDRVGYTGSSRGSASSIYAEDVSFLCELIDAHLKSAVREMRKAHDEQVYSMRVVADGYYRELTTARHAIALLQAELDSLKDGGKIKPLPANKPNFSLEDYYRDLLKDTPLYQSLTGKGTP